MKNKRARAKDGAAKTTWKGRVVEFIVLPAVVVVGGYLAFVYFAQFWDDESRAREAVSASGLRALSVSAPRDPDGFTLEQRNIMRRLEEDNRPGATQHYYIISPISGQIVSYSTVRGKVTSAGKRLSPYSVAALYRPTTQGGGQGENRKFSDFRWVGGYELLDDRRTPRSA